MISQFFENVFGGRRGLFVLFFLAVTVTLVGGAYWVIAFVQNTTSQAEEPMMAEGIDSLSLIYVNYNASVDEYISAEAYLTMGDYLNDGGPTENVQVLTDLSRQEIVGYMLNHFVAGMQVNCSHCHNLQNYAADVWDDEEAMANKMRAREHLLMTQDLNQNWLTQLPSLTENKAPSGAQITCATCHFGQAQPITWPEGEFALPDDFRLPLDEPLYADEEDLLNVNARTDISLDTVQYNQQVMYYWNASLNVGCTHCHNSRYFPSWEVPAKFYATHMLQMTQHLAENYSETLGGQEPSCYMCHYGAPIPPGSAISVDVMPNQLVGDAGADEMSDASSDQP